MLAIEARAHDFYPAALMPLDMVEYVSAEEYSKKSVKEAGKAIIGFNPEPTPELIEAFRIAHRWRDSYKYPMHTVRRNLGVVLRKNGLDGVTAARLKRMQSIRRKLKKGPLSLYQLQDIGGCRVIMDTIEQVDTLVGAYWDGQGSQPVMKEDNHVATPKRGGYRSRHVIFKFSEPPYDRQFIELQVRTKLQHSWATAVEAVGLVRGENLKGGEGAFDWLRLFEIMAAEFSVMEGRPIVPYVSEEESERRAELSDLVEKLDAIRTLESFRDAILFTESFIPKYSRYFLIQYDNEEKRVRVRPIDSVLASSESYIEEEKNAARNTVLVEVDRVQDLREAYPNYFLDVENFVSHLSSIVTVKKERSHMDLSWLKDFLRRSDG